MQIHWIDFHDRPAPKGRTLLLKTHYGVIYTGEWREGHLGEPQQSEAGWRAGCCGRFSTPAYWAELSESPACLSCGGPTPCYHDNDNDDLKRDETSEPQGSQVKL